MSRRAGRIYFIGGIVATAETICGGFLEFGTWPVLWPIIAVLAGVLLVGQVLLWYGAWTITRSRP